MNLTDLEKKTIYEALQDKAQQDHAEARRIESSLHGLGERVYGDMRRMAANLHENANRAIELSRWFD